MGGILLFTSSPQRSIFRRVRKRTCAIKSSRLFFQRTRVKHLQRTIARSSRNASSYSAWNMLTEPHGTAPESEWSLGLYLDFIESEKLNRLPCPAGSSAHFRPINQLLTQARPNNTITHLKNAGVNEI